MPKRSPVGGRDRHGIWRAECGRSVLIRAHKISQAFAVALEGKPLLILEFALAITANMDLTNRRRLDVRLRSEGKKNEAVTQFIQQPGRASVAAERRIRESCPHWHYCIRAWRLQQQSLHRAGNGQAARID